MKRFLILMLSFVMLFNGIGTGPIKVYAESDEGIDEPETVEVVETEEQEPGETSEGTEPETVNGEEAASEETAETAEGTEETETVTEEEPAPEAQETGTEEEPASEAPEAVAEETPTEGAEEPAVSEETEIIAEEEGEEEAGTFADNETPAEAYFAQIGDVKYETLQAAFDAASDGDTVTLLGDVDATGAMYAGDSRYNLWVNKNLTIDGAGGTLTVKGRGIGVKGSSSNINVTIKNVTIRNVGNADGRVIDTRGNIGSLTLDHVTLTTADSTYTGYLQPLTIGGNQSDPAAITITDSTITTVEGANKGYAIITFNPVNLTITNSTIKGWADLYLKGVDSSAGSAGSVVTVTGSTLISANGTPGYSNAFSLVKIEDDNVTVNITGSTIDVNGVNNTQSIVSFQKPDQTNAANCNVTLGEGNNVTLSGDAEFVIDAGSNTFAITGGTFTTKPADDLLAEGYVIEENDGKYQVVSNNTYTVSLNKESYSVEGSGSASVQATVTRSDGEALTADDKTGWTMTFEPAILEVTGSTWNQRGTNTLTVKRNNGASLATQTVTAVLSKGGKTYATTEIAVSPKATITTDSTTKFVLEGTEKVTSLKINYNEVNQSEYLITSNDETVATVAETAEGYEITPLKAGKVTFTVARKDNPGETATATITFIDPAAQVGENYYKTLSAAFNAAQSGDTITLLGDVTESISYGGSQPRTDGFTLTLDLNGHVLTGKSGQNYALRVDYGIITIKDSAGGGGIHHSDNYAMMISHLAGEYVSKVIIEGGDYTGKTSVVQVGLPGGADTNKKYYGGELEIRGGTFTAVPDTNEEYDENGNFKYLLNILDFNEATYPGGMYSPSKITVSGGTFNRFDPMNNVAEGTATDFTAEGYESYQISEGVYGVRLNVSFTAELDKDAYTLTTKTTTVKATVTREDGEALTVEDKTGWTLVYEPNILTTTDTTWNAKGIASNKVTRVDATSLSTEPVTVSLVKDGQVYDTATITLKPTAVITTDVADKLINAGPENVTKLAINGTEVALSEYTITSNDETAATVTATAEGGYVITPLKAGKAAFTVAKKASPEEKVEVSLTFVEAAAQIGEAYYSSLSKAFNAAVSGDTIVLLQDITESVDFSGSQPRTDGFTLTLDLNGHVLTGQSGKEYALRVDYGIVTIKDSAGNGGIHYSDDYAIIISHLAGEYVSKVIIEGGNYTGKTTVVQTGASGGTGANKKYYGGELEIRGGTFTAVPDTDETYDENGNFKYLLNMLDFNEAAYPGGMYSPSKITVSGGTFHKFDPTNNVAEGTNTNFCDPGYRSVLNENGDYVVEAINYVAQIGDAKYESLEEAVAAAEDGATITLLTDAAGNGIKVSEGKYTTGLTIDFGGHTYTVDGITVGSTGTETQAFQLLKDNKITFKNGTITSSTAKMLIQNYSNLTLDNVTLDGTKLIDANGYVLSTNNGTTIIKDTTINTKAGDFAFDACSGWGSYPGNNVEVTGTSVINGNVEVSYYGQEGTAPASLALTSGTLNGEIVMAEGAEKAAIMKSDSFEAEAPTDYKWVSNGDGTSTLAAKEYTVQAGEKKYETLAEAVADTKSGTIKLLSDISGAGIFIAAADSKNIEIDLDGHTYTVNGPAVGSAGTQTQGFHLEKDNTITIKNGTISSTTDSGVLMLVQNYSNLTLDGVTLDGTNLPGTNAYVVSTNNGNTVFKDTTINAKEGDFAFDACSGWGGYAGNNIEVTGTSVINGNVEVSYYGQEGTAPAGLSLTSGTLNGAIVMAEGAEKATVTKSDSFEAAAPADYKWVSNGDGTSTLTAKEYVAKVGEAKYESLEEAVAAANDGATVTLLADTSGNGIIAPQGKYTTGLTIDFNGHTYTVDGATVGSTGTETNGFQLLMNNKITLKNGTLTSAKAKILVQNYSDLTVQGMTLELNNPNYASAYTLSNNNGEIVIDSSTIKANPAGGYAFDVCRYASYPKVNVEVTGNSTIEGNVEISASGSDAKDGFGLTLTSGTITGEIVMDASAAAAMEATPEKVNIVKASTFDQEAPEGYKWNEAGRLVAIDYAAQIGTQKYETLEAAVSAAADGETITLLRDAAGNGIVVPTGKFTNGLTVDFNGHTYTVDGATVGSTGTETNGFQLLMNNKITLKNGTLTSEKAKILVQNYSDLSLEGMTLSMTNAGYANGYTLSNNNGNVVIDGSTINANTGGGFAFDVCRYSSYPKVNVEVTGNSTINGNVEIYASGSDAKDGFGLKLTSGTLNGEIVVDATAKTAMKATPEKVNIVKANTIEQAAPAGYVWEDNGDGTSTLAIAKLTVTFDSDGGSNVDAQVVLYNETAVAPTAPEKVGYTFLGWFLGEELYEFNTAVTENLTLKAKWEINKYTVTFDSNGGSEVSAQTVEHGGLAEKPEDPTREGAYVFGGWQYEGKAFKFTTPITGDITLTASWKDAVAQVGDTYYATVSAAINAVKGTTGKTVTILSDQELWGIFNRFTVAAGTDFTLDLGGHTVMMNGAYFTLNGGGLTVKNGTINTKGNMSQEFTVNSGTLTIAEDAVINGTGKVSAIGVFGPAVVNVAGTLTAENSFAIAGNGTAGKGGYTINITGGNVTSANESAVYHPNEGTLNISGGTITGTTAVYQKAGSLNITGGTLNGNGAAAAYTYNGNGANATGDALVVDNCGYPGGAPTAAISGGTFNSTNGKGIGAYAYGEDRELPVVTSTINTITLAEDQKWFEEGGHYVIHEFNTVTFVTEEGIEAPEAQEVIRGTTAEKPADPEKTGHTFLGWYKGETAYDFNTAVTEDVTLTAKWEANKYTITFSIDGKETVTTQTFGEALEAPADPERPNYVFDGWEPALTETVEGDKTYVAKWKGAEKQIIYADGMGNVLQKSTAEYDTLTPAFTGTLPEREGYRLDDENIWVPAVSEKVLKDVVYELNWIKQVTVTFKNEEEEVKVVLDKDLTVPADQIPDDPQKTGYTFLGWYKGETAYDFSTAVAGDITLTAKFAINEYTVTFDAAGGSETEAQAVKYNEKAAKPADPEKETGIFSGWYLGETAYDFNTPVTADITLTAHWTDAAAQIGTQKYETLEAAVAAAQDGETVTLLTDAAGNGIVVPQGKFTTGLTIDFNGHTYTVDGATVGSAGTQTNGFQLLKNNKITLKNGTLTSAKAKILVQNYSDLTVQGMTLTMTNEGYASAYTLSNNNGSIVIDGSTINANTGGGFAFDVCRYSSYPKVNVEVTGDSTINGNVEIYASGSDAKDGFGLKLTSGTLNGEIVVDATAKTAMEAAPEKVSIVKVNTIEQAAPVGYAWEDNGDGTSTLAIAKFTVTFDAAGGSETEAQTVKYNEKAAKPADPEKETGIFSGWYLGETEYDFNTSVTADITLTAHWTDAAAQIGTQKYETLEAAVAAAQDGETITLLADAAGNGIKVPQGKYTTGLTIDFNGHTYTVDGSTVGSTGTETNGFQLLKNNKITLKNGTITSAKAKILVQNYSDLSLEGMTLSMNNAGYASAYTLSNNNGNIKIDGSTIKANPAGGYAFDVCRYSSYPSVNVEVTGNSTIEGNVEIYASGSDAKDGFGLKLTSGTLNGEIVVDATAKTAMEAAPEKVRIVKANTIEQAAPVGYAWEDNGDGTSTLAIAKFTVTFDAAGGTETEAQTVKYNEKAVKPADPEKTGHTFLGWYKGETAYDFNTAVTEDITLTAKYDINEYTVTFDSDGGSNVDAQVVLYNETAVAPTAPVKVGYTFLGWFLGEELYEFNTAVTENLTLKAKWEINEYTVTFDSAGGSAAAAQTVKYNEKASKPADPEREHYNFVQWNLEGNAYDFNTPVTGDITLTAEWSPKTYTITFVIDEDKIVTEQTYGEKLTAPEVPEVENLDFNGWEPELTETVEGDKLYTATWKGEEKQVIYADGMGNVLMKNTVHYGEDTPVYTGEIPSREGYRLDENNLWTPAVAEKVLKDAVYELNWISQVTVTFTDGETAVKSLTLDRDTVIPEGDILADPVKENHIFGGWTLNGQAYDFSETVTESIVLNAKWIAAEASVNGTLYATFAEAAQAAGTDVITVLTDVSDTYKLKAGETLKVAKNGHTVTVAAESDPYEVIETVGQDGVSAYTTENKAEKVDALIEAIGTPVTTESAEKIQTAREAYEALNEGSKEFVTKLADLEAAEAALAALQAEVEHAAAVDALIEAIEEPITVEDAEAIQAAREAYDALTDAEKALVTKKADLEAAEAALAAAQAEIEHAAAVDALIEAIEEPITVEDAEAIQAAREAYDALTDAEKALVTKKADLEAAEAALAAAQAEIEHAAAVDALIEAIEEPITVEDAEAIQTAREAYDALTDAEKALVTKLADLEKAETELADAQAANAVDELITAIGTPVTPESAGKIKAARDAYEALTDTQKELVTKLSELEAAEKALADAVNAKAVDDLIDKIGTPVTLDSAEAIQTARAAYEALTDAEKERVEKHADLEAAEAAYAGLVTELINAIEEPVTLDSADAIKAAREAYDKATAKDLVENYSKLTDAEKALARLEEETYLKDGIRLDHEYIVLDPGQSLQLSIVDAERFGDAEVTWSVENSVNEPFAEGTEPIISVEDGLVTAGEVKGTAYVRAAVKGESGTEYYARCRVDVITKEIRNDLTEYGVRLVDTKTKVSLFSTNYTPVRVQLTMLQNMEGAGIMSTNSSGEEEPEHGDAKIYSAEFTNRTVAKIFDLRVTDDLTLEIVPKSEYVTTDSAVLKTIKGKYKSAITLIIDDMPYTTDQTMTLTVNKKLPKVTAAAVKLNSFYDDAKSVVIKGGTAESITAVDAIPWLVFENTDEGTAVRYNLGANGENWKLKKSAKVNLSVSLQGWAVPVNVKMSVKTAPTLPKLKFKPASLTLKPQTNDTAATSWTITPAVFAEDDVMISGITEGKTTIRNTGDPYSFEANGLISEIEDGKLYVTTTENFDSSKARTFKVLLGIDGVEYPVTVKTLKQASAVAMTLKPAGTINLSIPGSFVKVTASMKNYNRDAAEFEVTKITDAAGADLTDRFTIDTEGNVIILTAGEGLQVGTYTATVKADCGSVTVEKTVKIKVNDKAAAQSITLKGKGTIDVLRPGTAVTLTPSFKNCYEHELTDVVIMTKSKVTVTEKFDWEEIDGKIVISVKDGEKVSHAEKYTVSAVYKVNGTDVTVQSKAAALSVKQGKSSAKISTKKVQLLKNDRFSTAEVEISLTDETVSGIDRINFVSPKINGVDVYTLRELGNGRYAIAFNNNTLPAKKKYKGGTVKIQIFMKGNETAKANTTFKVKVTVK